MNKFRRGQAPFGFRWQDAILHLEPVEANIRKIAFNLFLELRSMNGVAKELNRQDYPTRRGGRWTDVQVARILECTSAVGNYQTVRSGADGSGKRTTTSAAERVVIECEPIVSRETWESVTAILASKRELRQAEIADALSGKIWCTCGAKMRHDADEEKFRCASCRKTLLGADLEDVFASDFGEIVVSHPLLCMTLGRSPESARIAEQLAGLETALLIATQKREGVERMYQEKAVNKSRFQALYLPLEKEVADLEAQIRRLDAKLKSQPATPFTPTDWHSTWAGWSKSRRRQVIGTFVDRITLGSDEFNISYLLPEPSAPKDAEPPQQNSTPTNQHSGSGPTYIRLPKAGENCPITGLSRAKLNELILPNPRNQHSPPVASKSLRQPGQQRGVRLILLESLMDYLNKAK